MTSAPAKVLKATDTKVGSWLIDAGRASDLSRFDDAGKRRRASYVEHPVSCQTASSAAPRNYAAKLHVYEFSQSIKPDLQESTPAVLSDGRRTMEAGLTLIWPAHDPRVLFFHTAIWIGGATYC